LAGDTRLFFQHKRIGADRRVWPKAWKRLGEDHKFRREITDWPNLDFWPEDEEEAYDEYIHIITERDEDGNRGCPFYWIWD